MNEPLPPLPTLPGETPPTPSTSTSTTTTVVTDRVVNLSAEAALDHIALLDATRVAVLESHSAQLLVVNAAAPLAADRDSSSVRKAKRVVFFVFRCFLFFPFSGVFSCFAACGVVRWTCVWVRWIARHETNRLICLSPHIARSLTASGAFLVV
jgi:hypothetical protein